MLSGVDSINVWAVIGFCLAAYAIVANDAIQTLGTFLSSNTTRPWWVLWLYATTILLAVLLYSFFTRDGDVSYGRLDAIPTAGRVGWMHCIPPLALLILTRFGFPVSTTFLILTFFAPARLDDMLIKSLVGYAVAIVVSLLSYRFLASGLEKRFFQDKQKDLSKRWVVAQWASTGFLWSQWLIQDLANIYVYAGVRIDAVTLIVTLVVLAGLLAYTFFIFGGEIQKIVTAKVNTHDIRSATLIDLQFGVILLVFKEWSNMPMSTTWVFLGVLAGREFVLTSRLQLRSRRETTKMVGSDLAKAAAGLAVSVALALGLPLLVGRSAGDQVAQQSGLTHSGGQRPTQANP